MTASPEITNLFAPWAQRVGLAMEIVWLLAIFLVPLPFATPAVMGNGYDLPKVTLYRSLIGLLGALWLIEWGLTLRPALHRFSWPSRISATEWLERQPTRWVLVGACLVLGSNLVSTLLSPSVGVSLWGSETALDGSFIAPCPILSCSLSW